jgi:uncharacterized SAM-binding protein YcdF (DUF218 family)
LTVKEKPITQPRAKKWLAKILVLALLFAVAVCFRAPLLRGMAAVWIANEPVAKADAIVVLGGGLETRPFEAARLYHQGIAPRILLLNTRRNNTDEMGITTPGTELTRQVLLKKGVPEEALVIIGKDVASTHDECVAVRKWVEENHAKTILIPTDPFHTRRVKWFFGKALKGTGVEIRTEAVTPRDYTATNWWQNEEGLIAFESEVIKFAYYLVKY